MSIIQSMIIIAVVLFVSAIIFFYLDSIYRDAFTIYELILAKKIFIVLVINLVIHVLSNVFQGVITGYNKFTFVNLTKLLALIIRTVMLLLFIHNFDSAFTIVLVSLFVDTISMIIYAIVIKYNIKLSPKFYSWDLEIFY